MRRPIFVIASLIAATALMPAAADAQFPSPRGIIGTVTAPLRGLLQRLPHPPVRRHRPARNADARQPAAEQDEVRLGRTGPLAWPTAYEDVLGYTFWPGDFAQDYREHGFGDIVATLVGPLDLSGPVVSDAARGNETTGAADGRGACDDAKPAQADWPAAQIAQTIELTPAQRAALDRLQAAMMSAAQSIRSDCRDSGSLAPRQRLDAMVQRLWAVQNAGVRIRAPLAAFYDTLTAKQKARFDAPKRDEKRGGGDKAADGPMGRQYAACAAQGSDDADRLIKQISQAVRPAKEQRPAVEALGRQSGDLAKLLLASCTQPIADTPLARLDAANARLASINFAATAIEVALNGFYAGLSDQQKTRFDALAR